MSALRRGLVLPEIVDEDDEAGRFTRRGAAKKRPDWAYT